MNETDPLAHRQIKQLQSSSSSIIDDGSETVSGGKKDQNKCRVCLYQGNIPIYGSQDLSVDLQTVTGVDIMIGDEYPKHLCGSCYGLLKGAIHLREIAQESDKVLKLCVNESALVIGKNLETIIGTKSDIDGDDWFDSINNVNEHENELVKQDPDIKKRRRKVKKILEEPQELRKCRRRKKGEGTLIDEILQQFSKDKEANIEFGNVRPQPFYCVPCKINFNSNVECSTHMAEKHGKTRITCPICNNSYNPTYFKTHLELHKNKTDLNKGYVCDYCGKKFPIQVTLIQHRVTHIDEFPYPCSLCSYRGRSKNKLNLHMRTHTKEKKYECPHCPVKYTTKSNLNRHVLTHKLDFDFKCDECEKGFHRKRDLDMHIKIDHKGINDHVCNLCGKAFGERGRMMKHQRRVHKRTKMKSGRPCSYMLLQSQQRKDCNESEELPPEHSDKRQIDNINDHPNMMVEVELNS